MGLEPCPRCDGLGRTTPTAVLCTYCDGMGQVQVHWMAPPPFVVPAAAPFGLRLALNLIEAEVQSAEAKWAPMNSAHEAFAVLLEEVDELKAHVWAKQGERDLDAMRKEAIQVAAMAVRFVRDVCDGGRGRK